MVNTPCSVLSARYVFEVRFVAGVGAGAGAGAEFGPEDEDARLAAVVILLVARGILSVLVFER